MTLDRIKEIPKLPQVSMELIRHAFKDEPDIQEVAAIVERDPTLTAKLFKTVNSAAFGLRVEVKGVQQAISIMGLDALRSTVVAIALGEYFTENSMGKALDTKRFCTHSLATAVIIQKAALALGIRKGSQLYLIGLLHDLGKIALDFLGEPSYGDVLKRVARGKSFEESELEVFSTDNQQVWRKLAEDWGFPEEIVELYAGTQKSKLIVPTWKLVLDASNLSDMLGYSILDPKYQRPHKKKDIFSTLSEPVVMDIGESVHKQVGIMSGVLDLPLPDMEQMNTLLMKSSYQLSKANSLNIKNRHELEFRVSVLEELTKVFTGIIKTLDSESLAFSVLESLMEGFHLDGAFLLTSDARVGLSGYSAWLNDQGDADVQSLTIKRDAIPKSLMKCANSSVPIKITASMDEAMMKQCLGQATLAWLAPIYVRGNFSGLIGVGIRDRKSLKLNSEDFGKIFNIVAGEVGLALDNTRLYKHMRKEARFDALTGMFNRRTIMKILFSEFARFKRKGDPLSVVIFDMDHFKAINDNRGHLAGDDFLKNAAQILNNGTRESDYIGRYGGDEFIGVFPDTKAEDSVIVVERIRTRISEYCAQFEEGSPEIGARLSISAGVAGAHESMTKADDLINLADQALYKAKQKGRDHCVISGDPVTASS